MFEQRKHTMNPRQRCSALILLLSALAALPAEAQMTLTSQARSVSIGGSFCGNPSASAPNFGPFSQTVTVATGAVSQNSTLSSTSIVGTGSTSPSGSGGGSCPGINGSSNLNVTFTVAQPVTYTFAFSASIGLCAPSISLIGPGTNIVYNFSTMGTTPQSVSGTLQPGSYTVAASASGTPDHGTLTACGWNINLSAAFPSGACCNSTTGACTIGVASACAGTFLGVGTPCSPSSCLGACCNRWTGNCVVTDSSTCASFGLRFNGIGGTCSTNACNACPADFNGVGGPTVQDVFDFLAAYFSGCP